MEIALTPEDSLPDDRIDLFVDVATFLAGGAPSAPPRVVGTRSDGEALFYAGQVNFIFGDPESGKTMLADACAAEALQGGRKVAIIDMDHNGIGSTASRLLMLGADTEAITSMGRFRYCEPEDQQHLVDVIRTLVAWQAAVVVVDSIGELLPMLGLSSNQPDDFTVALTKVLKPLAMAGASVLALDHLAKNTESRASGPTGTGAKRRAVGGVSLRVVAAEAFTPGQGGRAVLSINKDRHGGLRAVSPKPDKGEVYAGTFILDEAGTDTNWSIAAPNAGSGTEDQPDIDVEILGKLVPPPSSVRDVRARMHWGSKRAATALTEWRTRARTHPTSYGVEYEVQTNPEDGVPGTPPIGEAREEHSRPACIFCDGELLFPASIERGFCERCQVDGKPQQAEPRAVVA